MNKTILETTMGSDFGTFFYTEEQRAEEEKQDEYAYDAKYGMI